MRDKLFAISQTGVSHLSTDIEQIFSPCQDAYKVVDFPGKEVPDWNGSLSGTIIAVADGHGNPVYHGSSEFGSKLAVESAVTCMLKLLTAYEIDGDVEHFYDFPEMVATEWKACVLNHANSRFPEENLRDCFAKEQDYENYLERIYMDYGSTLLVTVTIPERKLLIATQIGDGDILLMYKADKKQRVHRLVNGNAKREFGSRITDSLCMYRADEKFQMEIFDGREYPEDAEMLKDFVLMVATDGISTGAVSESCYLNDYCGMRMNWYMCAENQADREFIQQQIEEEMQKEIRSYSSDDMTVVFLAVNNRDGNREDDGGSERTKA